MTKSQNTNNPMSKKLYDSVNPKTVIKPKIYNVGIGEILVKKGPARLKTALGSCVAIMIHDDKNKIGGMIHIILSNSLGRDKKYPGRYADLGIPLLIQRFKKEGGEVKNIKAHIVGGNNLITNVAIEKSIFAKVGLANLNAAKELLEKEGIKYTEVSSRKPTGTVAILDTETGLVTVSLLDKKCCK
jgi:chemotaxis protein CheD